MQERTVKEAATINVVLLFDTITFTLVSKLKMYKNTFRIFKYYKIHDYFNTTTVAISRAYMAMWTSDTQSYIDVGKIHGYVAKYLQ